MFSVVFASANQQLVIFNHTGTAVHFQRCDRGTEQECGAVEAAGGPSAARRGGAGEKPSAHLERAKSCPQMHRHHHWNPLDKQIPLPFQQPAPQRCWMNSECAPEVCVGLYCHQEGMSWPSLTHFILAKLWWLYGWCCTHRGVWILMHYCKIITHLPEGQSRLKDLVWLGVFSSSLQACSVQHASGYEHLWSAQKETQHLDHSKVPTPGSDGSSGCLLRL